MIRNTNVDVTDKALPFAKPRLADGTGNLVELFAGSRSVGSVAEAKGMITADYQNYLEKEWLSYLKNKYTVKVNEEVLNTVK
mgnify:CR=1 FL=1